jgi:hypothetical protein
MEMGWGKDLLRFLRLTYSALSYQPVVAGKGLRSGPQRDRSPSNTKVEHMIRENDIQVQAYFMPETS